MSDFKTPFFILLFSHAIIISGCRKNVHSGKFSSPNKDQTTKTEPNPSNRPMPQADDTPFKDDRTKLAQELWATTLGEMFNEYLFGVAGASAIPKQSQLLVDRIFDKPYLLITRIAALQFLSEDLYSEGRMTEDATRRLLILEGAVSERRLSRVEAGYFSLIEQAIPFVLVSIPFGSPAVREEVMHGVRNLATRFKSMWSPGSETLETINWHRLGMRNAINGYQFAKALQFLVNTYGPYSTAYLIAYPYIKASTQGPNRDFLLRSDRLLQMDPL